MGEFLFLLRGFVLARVLGPALFGLWTQLKITLLFLQYGQLGTHEAMLREVPLALGTGNEPRAHRIESSVLGFNLTSSAVLTTAIVLLALALTRDSTTTFPAWLLLAALFPLSQLYWYIHLQLRARRRFNRVSLLMVAFALLSTVIGLLAAAYAGLQGFLVALAASYAGVILLTNPGGLPVCRPALDLPLLRSLLRTGLPIMASGAALILLWNVDKLAIWQLMSRESLGIYALPAYVLTSVTLLPEALAAVLYPRFLERLAQEGTASALEGHFARPTLLICHLACPVVGVLFLALHLPIVWLLPDYAPGILPGRVLVAALFFMVVTRIPCVLLLSLKKQTILLLLTTMAATIGAVSVITLIWSGWGLVGAAAGAAISYVVYFGMTITASLVALRIPVRRALSLLAAILLPLGVTVVAVALALLALPRSTPGSWPDLASTLGGSLIVVAANALTIWLVRGRLFSTATPKPASSDPTDR
jgi:O-antigen/teichoic acid export membrane protein